MYYFNAKPPARYRRLAAAALLFAAAAAVSAGLLSRTGDASAREGSRLLRQSITDAAVCCYAIEGRYPQDLQYIIDNYGVRVDTKAYIVSYGVYGENLLPDIRVYAKGE